MSARLLRLVPLLAALAGCVDFVDPAGIRLAEPTRIDIGLELSSSPNAGCGGAPVELVPRPGLATLCLNATVRLGRDKVGERDRLAADTLRALGVAVPPEIGPDSVYRYTAGFRIPREALDDTVFTVTLPQVEGAAIPLREIRWVAAEPLGPDTLLRGPTEGIQLRLALPRRQPVPLPSSQSWQALVAGSTAGAQYNGFNSFPRPVYDFPASVLAGLGGDRFSAHFNWRQSFARSFEAERVQVFVALNQNVDWAVRTLRPASP